MSGYHDANAKQLEEVNRFMRGEPENQPELKGETEMAKEEHILPVRPQDVPHKARKGRKEQKQMPGMEDDTPQELIDLGKDYKRIQTAESKAKEKTKAKTQEILDKMHELGIQKFRVEVDGNMKWLTIKDNERLKWEKSQTAPEDE